MSNKGHSNALLFEIIIVLFFFALSATVVLNMFLTSHELSLNSRAMNKALYLAENECEALSAAASPQEYLESAGYVRAGDAYEREAEGDMKLTVSIDSERAPAGQLMKATVLVEGREQSTLAELPMAWYVPDAVGGAA